MIKVPSFLSLGEKYYDCIKDKTKDLINIVFSWLGIEKSMLVIGADNTGCKTPAKSIKFDI
jgi:hypothetical protein